MISRRARIAPTFRRRQAHTTSAFSLDRTIRVGECLTIATIIISVVALSISWARDRQLQMRAQADEVRHAAGMTLATLDRMQSLSELTFVDVQPLFIEVSQAFDEKHDVVAARDLLWKGIGQARQRHEQRMLDERIENGYTVLLAYDPNMRALFRSVLERRRIQEDAMFQSLLGDSEEDVLSFHGRTKDYTPALLGNALRLTAAKHQKAYVAELSRTLRPLQLLLTEVLSKTDEEIVIRGRETFTPNSTTDF